MLSEPRWFYDAQTKTMVINLIKLTSTNIMAKEGIGTVQMTLGETNYTNVPNINPIIIVYTPDPGLNGLDYSVAWDNYIRKTFPNQPGLTLTPSGGPPGTGLPLTYTLTNTDDLILHPMTLVIKTYEVQIKNI